MDKLTDVFNMCEDECEYSRGEAKEKCPIYKICYIRQVYDKLKDYEDLEEQGLLLRLPCKVGDTVWFVPKYNGKSLGFIREDKVQMVGVTARGIHFKLREHHEHNKLYMLGKTVFLTKEEAEAKLREMEVGE